MSLDNMKFIKNQNFSSEAIVISPSSELNLFYMNMQVFEKDTIPPKDRVSVHEDSTLSLGSQKYTLKKDFDIWCAVHYVPINHFY